MIDRGLKIIARNETLSERVREALRRALIEGRFSPGERIKIRDVAAAVGVSPTPAREALMNLIAEGVLNADTNKTARVPSLNPASLREITALRLALETLAIGAAVAVMTRADIDAIEAFEQASARAARERDWQKATQQNAAFHFAIYQHAGMPLAMRMIETTWLRSGAYLALARGAFETSRHGLPRHQAILKALRAGDAKAAQAALAADIEAGAELLSRILERHLEDGEQEAVS